MSNSAPTNTDARAVAIVANPYSGAKENRQRVAALVEALQRIGIKPVVMWGRDELRDAAADTGFTDEYRCVVAAGGDGTLHRVLNTTTALPIAHFPLGTENLFATHFAHTADPDAFARMVRAGRVLRIDLARASYPAGDRPDALFGIVGSAGFDGEVIHRLDRWRCSRGSALRRVRRGSYAWPILGAAFGYRFPMMEIEADDRPLHGTLCMVFNLPRYGLGLHVCPQANPRDGLLDYLVMRTPGPWPLMTAGLAAKCGRLHERHDLDMGTARRIRITHAARRPVPMELDGEEAGHTPVQIEALPGAMQVLQREEAT